MIFVDGVRIRIIFILFKYRFIACSDQKQLPCRFKIEAEMGNWYYKQTECEQHDFDDSSEIFSHINEVVNISLMLGHLGVHPVVSDYKVLALGYLFNQSLSKRIVSVISSH